MVNFYENKIKCMAAIEKMLLEKKSIEYINYVVMLRYGFNKATVEKFIETIEALKEEIKKNEKQPSTNTEKV